jgi:hypothetical protein
MSCVEDDSRRSELSAADRGVIAVRLRDVRQLFDAMDPSPFREKDVDSHAEGYIVESIRELPSQAPTALVIYLDQRSGLPDETRAIGDALQAHFRRRATLLRRDLRRLVRRGLVSLAIGVSFLALLFAAARLVNWLMGEGALASLFKESLIIGGWVAMWRPLEIFLYDWWPILGEQRIHERLSRLSVRVVPGCPKQPDDLTRILEVGDAPLRLAETAFANPSSADAPPDRHCAPAGAKREKGTGAQ